MLLTKTKFLCKLKLHSVVSFVGYANFIKIPTKTLNEINWMVDGITLSKVFSLLNVKVDKQSFDFTGIADKVFTWCIKNNYKIHFIGGSTKDSLLFVKKIKNIYPKLKISGQDGYCSIINYDFNDLDKIDVCVYGLGSPFQEKLSLSNRYLFKYSFTCGAFITQTANSTNEYYPPFFVKYNLRWLYRIYKEKGHFMRLFKAFLKLYFIYIKSKTIIKTNNYK